MYIYTISANLSKIGIHPWAILGGSLGDLWGRLGD